MEFYRRKPQPFKWPVVIAVALVCFFSFFFLLPAEWINLFFSPLTISEAQLKTKPNGWLEILPPPAVEVIQDELVPPQKKSPTRTKVTSGSWPPMVDSGLANQKYHRLALPFRIRQSGQCCVAVTLSWDRIGFSQQSSTRQCAEPSSDPVADWRGFWIWGSETILFGHDQAAGFGR